MNKKQENVQQAKVCCIFYFIGKFDFGRTIERKQPAQRRAHRQNDTDLEDVRYYGYPCKAEKKIDVKAKSWMQIRARFEYEAVSSFGNKQPVLYLIDMEPAAEPEEKVVYLG